MDGVILQIWDAVWWISAALGIVSFLTYWIPQLYIRIRGPQDLKKKYGGEWALVTGGSSGIGRAMVERLASQGFNVVVVAYPDKLLDSSVKEYQEKWPTLSFRKIGLNLAGDFATELAKETEDIDISCVFNNAGYVKTGFFATVPIEAHLQNYHCNATSVVQITHLFVRRMREKGIKGCIGFTSSPAMMMACPFTVLYGGTKAFLSEFAVSLAPEIQEDGIDICVLHPSPTVTAFYDKAIKIPAIEFFRATAAGPDRTVAAFFAAIGRTTVCDQGYYPPMIRMLTKVVDVNLLSDIITMFATTMPDYKIGKQIEAEAKAGESKKSK